MTEPRMTPAALDAYLREIFPEAYSGGREFVIEDAAWRGARVRMPHHPDHLRPGGTISGPSMMGLGDFTMYAALLSSLGPVPLAVTTHLSINFLRKPPPRDLVATCRLIKLGRRLAVGDVGIASAGEDELVAHVTATYSIPPDRGFGEGV